MYRWLRYLTVSAFFCTFAPSLNALMIVDQSTFCPACSNGSQGIINDDTYPRYYREIAQTFAVANTGTLEAIDLYGIGKQSPTFQGSLIVFVVPVVSGSPITDLSQALGSASILLPFVGMPFTYGVSGFSVPVTAGDELALVLAASLVPGGTSAFSVDVSDGTYTMGGDYSAGNMFARDSSSATWSAGRADLLFRTYVECADPQSCVEANDPEKIAEPTTLALLGVGLLGLGAVGVRRYS